ncbi:MAG: S-layer protein [Methanoregula sp.]|nr:S-layer protein [Methanoregula sp.]
MNFPRWILVLTVLAVTCSLPVMGITTYLGGSPQISAVIAGTNEFTAGSDATINVLLHNSGVNLVKYVTKGTVERDDDPTTAKMLTVGLAAGKAPILVRSDPQNVGDLYTQGMITAPIQVKILSNATMGEYTVPLTATYTYLQSSDQPSSEVLQSDYQTVSQPLTLTIRIKPQIKIEVIEAVPENLNVGTEGYINLKIRNAGFEDGRRVTVQILRKGASPIIPTDGNIFIGDLLRNGTVSARYKVAVSADAGKETYPVDVAVTYENSEGDVVTSTPETVGIPVGGKITFAVVSDPALITPGSDTTINVTYRNTGDATAHNAQARITAVAPFSSSDVTMYLGEMKPGDVAIARYQLSSNGDAEVKNYTLDTQVRYRDALDNSQVSDTFKVPLTLVPKPAAAGFMQILPIVLLIALIAAGAGYYLLVIRKKK